jgi:hypothetical protein
VVTEALEAGVPVHVVRRMAGHSTVITTLDHHAHVRDQALRDAAATMKPLIVLDGSADGSSRTTGGISTPTSWTRQPMYSVRDELEK